MANRLEHWRTGLAFAVTLILAACAATVGRDFDSSYAQKIKAGVTTKAEVRQNVGPPDSVNISSRGETWQYMYMKSGNYAQNMGAVFGVTPAKLEMRSLVITFEGDVVKNFSATR